MIERLLPIALSAGIVAAGLLIVARALRQYRKDAGLAKGEQEKTPDVSFIINAFHDVTRKLKEKEKELERLKSLAEHRADSAATYTENVLQCVSNGVITFGENGTVRTVNRAAAEFLGISRDEAVGRTCNELFGDGDLCDAVRATLEQSTPSNRRETMLRRNSESLWLGYNTALLTDHRGESLGAILSFSDLTEVKRLQEQIELKERLTALGEMSAGIAHELRNPMGVIAGYLNLLAKKQDEPGRAIIRDMLTEINGMNRIIGDLLTFARPAALNRTSADLRELIEHCVAAVVQSRAGDAPPIAPELSLGDMQVNIDETLIRQAIGNILKNAVEAMPAGGSLAVSSAEGTNEVAITIRDTGEGIPPDKLGKIFLPFYTTKETGVGMGLALTHKIITSHGGRIEVESEKGKGTAFRVSLPKG